jgi:ABC-2 type transport system permease protein
MIATRRPAKPYDPDGYRGRVGHPRGAYRAVYRLLLRSVATRGRLVAVGLLSLAMIGVAAAVGTRPYDTLVSATRFADSGLTLLLPVGCLVFASATLGDLVDDGSLVYLWLRPLATRVPVLCAWLVTVTICVPLIGVPLLVCAVLMDGSAELLSGVTVSALVGIAAYSAIFVALGVRFRRALIWGLAYILLWEGFVATAGASAAKLAVRSYTRSILSEYTGVGIKLATMPLLAGIVVPLVAGALALLYASHRLRTTDVA